MGLSALAGRLAAAATRCGELVAARRAAAVRALAAFRGPHARHFATEVDVVLGRLATLESRLWAAGRAASAWPAPGPGDPGALGRALAAGIGAHPAADLASAVPDDLRHYVAVARADDPTTAALAACAGVDGLIAFATEAGARRLVPAASVVHLPVLGGDAAALRATSEPLAAWLALVADAFAGAGSPGLLAQLAEHPEAAGLLAGSVDGLVGPDAALGLLALGFERLDVATGGRPDGVVSVDDLEAAVDDDSLPPWLRAAAGWLLANPVLRAQLSVIDRPVAVGDPRRDRTFTRDDLHAFLRADDALRTLALHRDLLDVAAGDGPPDGHVGVDDLEAAAAGGRPEVAAAARYLLDHPLLTQRLAYHHLATERRADPVATPIELGWLDPSTGERRLRASGFDLDGLLALAVDQQAFGDDPVAARALVLSLPVADGRDPGLSIRLLGAEGVAALADAALAAAGTGLTDVHAVIAHLPETTDGTRNRLITSFYSVLADRADALFAGPDAGDPLAAGHPGANWLLFAPWASDGVGAVIDGSFSAFGVHPMAGQSQAAADGNQWIFDDIGRRYAAFIELVERTGSPSEADLERFFAERFGPGDEEIRRGFVAYAALLGETDAVQRQVLMLQADTLVATHEQAGAQHELEALSAGPDGLLTRYIRLRVAGRTIDVQHDLPPVAGAGNRVVGLPLLALDPGGRSVASFSDAVRRFAVGGDAPGVVDLVPISGVHDVEPTFPTATTDWWREGSGLLCPTPTGTTTTTTTGPAPPVAPCAPPSPDGLEGSGASSWPDPAERMWSIHKLFEQFLADPALWDRRSLDLVPIPGVSPAG